MRPGPFRCDSQVHTPKEDSLRAATRRVGLGRAVRPAPSESTSSEGRRAVREAYALPLLLSLAAAVLFAFGNHFSRVTLRFFDSRTVVLWTICISAAIYWLAAPFYMKADYWTASVLPLLIVIGFFRPLLSANLGIAGTRILGPTITATVSATAPLFAVALGVMLLGETLSWEIAIGTFGIIAGVVMISSQGHSSRRWPLIALLLPISAGFMRSLAHALTKVALEEVPSPFFVTVVAYSVSFVVALANQARTGKPLYRPIAPGGVKWLFATGAAFGVAVLVLNMALLHGQLVVVAPVVTCAPLFTLLLGAVVFREEAITRRVVFAVLVVVPSVALIGIRG